MLANGKFKVLNRFYFTNLKKYMITYNVKENNKVIRRAKVSLDIAPQGKKELAVNVSGLKAKVGTEYFVEFSAQLRQNLKSACTERIRDSARTVPLADSSATRSFRTGGLKLCSVQRKWQSADCTLIARNFTIRQIQRSGNFLQGKRYGIFQ